MKINKEQKGQVGYTAYAIHEFVLDHFLNLFKDIDTAKGMNGLADILWKQEMYKTDLIDLQVASELGLSSGALKEIKCPYRGFPVYRVIRKFSRQWRENHKDKKRIGDTEKDRIYNKKLEDLITFLAYAEVKNMTILIDPDSYVERYARRSKINR